MNWFAKWLGARKCAKAKAHVWGRVVTRFPESKDIQLGAPIVRDKTCLRCSLTVPVKQRARAAK